MSNISILIQFIKDRGRVSYDEVSEEAFKIDPTWRSETFTRGLRRNSYVIAIGKNPAISVGSNNPIVAYKTVGFEVRETLKDVEEEALNENLRKIKDNFPNPWDNRNAIVELDDAIKNKDIWKKKFVLRRYKI